MSILIFKVFDRLTSNFQFINLQKLALHTPFSNVSILFYHSDESGASFHIFHEIKN